MDFGWNALTIMGTLHKGAGPWAQAFEVLTANGDDSMISPGAVTQRRPSTQFSLFNPDFRSPLKYLGAGFTKVRK